LIFPPTRGNCLSLAREGSDAEYQPQDERERQMATKKTTTKKAPKTTAKKATMKKAEKPAEKKLS
jgi:hypothetical protein